MAEKIEILLNGKSYQLPRSSSLDDLVKELGLKREQVAMEVNREIVKRDLWAGQIVQEKDQIEIVHFVGGGGK